MAKQTCLEEFVRPTLVVACSPWTRVVQLRSKEAGLETHPEPSPEPKRSTSFAMGGTLHPLRSRTLLQLTSYQLDSKKACTTTGCPAKGSRDNSTRYCRRRKHSKPFRGQPKRRTLPRRDLAIPSRVISTRILCITGKRGSPAGPIAPTAALAAFAPTTVGLRALSRLDPSTEDDRYTCFRCFGSDRRWLCL